MTIPVRIQMGVAVVDAQMHAVPRVGDKLRCAFHGDGIGERLHLVVTSVVHHQVGEPAGHHHDPEPFAVIVTVERDPAEKKHNEAVMERLARRG